MQYKQPKLTCDIIIEMSYQGKTGIVLIERKNPPLGWALPGGFVDYGESLEQTAIREAKEETSLDVTLIRQLHTYSEPSRDPRHHTVTAVYIAKASGIPKAMDDAKNVGIFTKDQLPPLVFDHIHILNDYFSKRY
ncbi:MAG: NUDIX hydrolase [Deltaproteobacteria bacterium GWA2_38_16]|nr:MAG: NUDIX hydrolase [Deltaproteobacteria bacterium GWA2_38_16]OGQ03641.1 MAG: NUDIX hydrolase [Deltaproteobacteria bacterium RIFCSPHIGHO2_02_FULL_38_15]OGQ35051.1 MAG: NUDIX hydrolase [Deltaproteobacteria bacterium RIFCSPLOWO2_01_FULL_38_9]OGQ61336.1 MAG: NUDIX hydrolase [Deltaproteobacteria bacterium RIFCSPLOWO2_12_FULL_38_8]HBQ21112.1 NUDIX hydrolase [Deltaproteobacteria bacterium]